MYVRDARNREEVWLLDHIEAMGLDEQAFRSRDYVVAIDEESNEKAGFGRIRVHTDPDGTDACELTSIGVLDGWRRQGVGAHLIERLLEYAGDQDFEVVYTLAPLPDYFAQFGFQPVDVEKLPPKLRERLREKRERHEDPVVPMRIAIEDFEMPATLRERFKRAGTDQIQRGGEGRDASEEAVEEFGIDPEEATYKYDPSGKRS